MSPQHDQGLDEGRADQSTAARAGEAVKEQARHVAGQLKEKAGQVRQQMSEKARHAAEQAESLAAGTAEQGKQRTVEELSHLSAAARAAAQTLREQQDVRIAGYADGLADQIERVTSYLRDKRVQDMARDVRQMARNHPALVMGGLFVAGLALARFLKATDRQTQDWDPSGAWAGGAGMGEPGGWSEGAYGTGETGNMPYDPMAGPDIEAGAAGIEINTRQPSPEGSQYRGPTGLSDATTI